MFQRRVYLDHTATTPTRREVIREMSPYFGGRFANPSSNHRSGLVARGGLEMARERIAGVLRCRSEEIIFTGSGTEANNLAIFGAAEAPGRRGRHIITSPIEHSSVMKAFQALERRGWAVTYLSVDECGRFALDHLARAIRPDTVLVSLGYINNEIGTVQDVVRIVEIVKRRQVLLHFDSVQAVPYVDLDAERLGADLMSFSGHKLYAPKGIGVLYVRSGTPLEPRIHGGMQEFGYRSGTENVAYAVGLSKAFVLNAEEKGEEVLRLRYLRDRLMAGILASVQDVIVTGDPANRAANHASFCFKGLSGKMLVRELSHVGIDASSGSACSSPRNDPSHVLSACGIPDEYLLGSLRLTLGRGSTDGQVDRVLRVLPTVIDRMRSQRTPYHNEPVFISQDEFRRRQAAAEAVILDVRPVRSPGGSLPGSQHVPPWRVLKHVRHLRRDTEILLVCYNGDVLSPDIHQLLLRNGFHNVKVLKGGMNAYVSPTSSVP